MERSNRVVIPTVAQTYVPCGDARSLANIHTKKIISLFD